MTTHEDYYACLGHPNRRVYISRTSDPSVAELSNKIDLADGSMALVGGEIADVRDVLDDTTITRVTFAAREYIFTPDRNDLRDWLAAIALVTMRGEETGDGTWFMSQSIYDAFGADNPHAHTPEPPPAYTGPLPLDVPHDTPPIH